MTRRAFAVLAAALIMLGGAIPALAHHSVTAEFDPSKEWTVTGVLTRVDWINPHTATWVDVKDDQTGKTETWGCEGNPPATYHRVGLKKEDWRVGEMITMTCWVAKDGSKHWGFLKEIKYLSDGHVLVFRLSGE